jgi:WD40 repeat protein
MQTLFQKKNKRIKLMPIIAGLLFFLVYFFIFAIPLQKELRIHIQWLIDLSDSSITESGSAGIDVLESTHAFSIGDQPGDHFGYFTDQGQAVFLKQIEERDDIPFRVTVSDRGFIYYAVTYTDLVYRDQMGNEKKIYKKPGPGFPLLTQDGKRLFMIKTDLSGLKELDVSGELLWNTDVPSWITSLDYTDDFVICGLGDGTVNIFDEQGNTVSNFSVQRSGVDCIYGVTFSKNNELFAGIAGVEPQYLFLGEVKNQEKPVSHFIQLDSDFRKEVRINFSDDGKLLFYEGEKAFNIFNVDSKEIVSFPLLGNINSFAYIGKIGVAAVVSGHNNFHEIVLLIPGSSSLFKDYFSGQKIYLSSAGNHLFFGVDNKIIRFDLVEE